MPTHHDQLVTPAQMREMDRRTIEEIGIPAAVLMERAALAAVSTLRKHFPNILTQNTKNTRIGILCGSGNNAGDGWAIARLLHADGFQVETVSLADPQSLRAETATNFQIAHRLGIAITQLSANAPASIPATLHALPPCTIWIDALLGTGLNRPADGNFAAAITFLNEQSAPVFAIDVPSGIDARTGQTHDLCVHATATVTFGFTKLGLTVMPARKHVGKLYTSDIGIPHPIAESVGFTAELLTPDWAKRHIPARPQDFHKGNAGRLLLLGGSREKSGAILMTAHGALAAGAGLITIGTLDELVPTIAPAIPEVMAAAMFAETFDDACESRLLGFLEGTNTVAIGPGMTTHDGARTALQIVLESEDIQHLVIDADALNILSDGDNDERLRQFSARTNVVLTPHPGEMAQILHISIPNLLQNPIHHAQQLAKNTGAIVVLKLATTIIAAPDGRLAVNSSGNPGMATGGMGDALTGIIAALLYPAKDPFSAVCLAVWAHGAAGDHAAKHATGQRALSVSSLLEHLGHVWRAIEPA